MDDSRSILVIGVVALLLLLSATGAIIAVNSNSNNNSDTRETAEVNDSFSYEKSEAAAPVNVSESTAIVSENGIYQYQQQVSFLEKANSNVSLEELRGVITAAS